MKQEEYRHVFGRCRTHATAVFVTEYMKDRFSSPHTRYPREAFIYEAARKIDGTITEYRLMICDNELSMEREDAIINTARAFVAARGDHDIWA